MLVRATQQQSISTPPMRAMREGVALVLLLLVGARAGAGQLAAFERPEFSAPSVPTAGGDEFEMGYVDDRHPYTMRCEAEIGRAHV